MDPYENVLLLGGLVALIAAWLPDRLRDRSMSLPMVLVAVGAIVFAFPVGIAPDHVEHADWVERATELGVIVSLTGAGLKLDRPLGWRTWATTWRLLAFGMPITIGLVAWVGALAGFGAGAAILIGAALAPTDPVLAADVQVGEPNTDADADHSTVEDEVRFSLTSEAGLNDGLAFPFVYLALAVAADGDRLTGSGFLHWLAIDLVGRVFVGVVAGICVGWVLSRVLFGHWRARHERNTATSSGFVAIAATLIAYGTAEMLHGYGFLAVFVAAVTVRSVERSHEYVGVLHTFADEFEQLLVVALLVAFGGALVNGMLAGWDGWTLLLAAFCVFVARPVACRIALIGARPVAIERRAIEFFGIRGIGSLYYVAYAVTSADFVDADRIWAVVASTVVLSVVVHGALATPVMRRLDRVRARRRRGRPEPVGVGALGG